MVSNNKNKYTWVMLAFSFAIAFLLHLLLFSTAPMVTTMMKEMNLSYTDFGLVFSAAMISLVLFRIPWGLVGDKIGYLNSLKIALPLSTAFAILRGFSSNYIVLLLSQFFLGVGLAAVLPCLSLIIKEWSPKSAGFSTGIYVAGFAVGNATALGLTPGLMEIMDWRTILLTYSGFAVILCILWLIFARSSEKGISEFHLGSIAQLLKHKYVWVLLLLMIACMGSYDTLATWMPKVLEMKGFNKAIASVLPLGFFLAGPIMGLISDRFKNNKVILAFLGIFAAASIAGINYAPFPLLMLCLLVAGLMTIGVLTICLAATAEHEHLSRFGGSVSGFISSLGNLGPLAIPIAFGFLIDVTGTFHSSILLVAAIAGITFILGAWLVD